MQDNTILTITGSDPTGESGIQADIKYISELGLTAVSAITTVTLQNTLGIQEFHDLPASVVGGQIEALVNDVQPKVVKIGMMRRVETIQTVVEALRRYTPAFVVYDPVLFSSRGDRLMGDEALGIVRRRLFPFCSVIVVRRHEAHALLGDMVPGNVCFIDDFIVKDIERQLSKTGKTILEIAQGLGFSSQAHLSRFFKNIVGKSPSEYRTWKTE